MPAAGLDVEAGAAQQQAHKPSPAGRPLVAPGRSAPHPILGREDEVITKEEWQRRLAAKHLADAYPQQLGPLLGEDPKRLGRFRVITLATTGIMMCVIFANMPAHDHKGRPTILSSVQARCGRVMDRVFGLSDK